MAFWKVLIIQDGVRARMCMGKDPDAINAKIKELDARQEAEICHFMIVCVFTRDLEKIKDILKNWKTYIEDAKNDAEFIQNKIETIKKMGGGGALGAGGYEMVVASCKPNCLEIQAELDADNPTEFSEKYGDSPEGALKILDRATRIYGAVKDPMKEINRWRKILEIEAEQ